MAATPHTPNPQSASPLTPAQLDARAAGSLSAGPVTPTLTHPIAVTDITMQVSSSAGIGIGMKVLIDSEVCRVAQAWLATPYFGTTTIPILRGQSGTVTAAHATGTPVVIGDAMTDFQIRSAPGLPTDIPGATPWSPTISMNPTDTVVPVPHAIGFTSVSIPASATLTLALPGLDLNGAMLLLVGQGAGTVTVASTPPPVNTGGLAGSAITFTAGHAKLLLANGGTWIYPATA